MERQPDDHYVGVEVDRSKPLPPPPLLGASQGRSIACNRKGFLVNFYHPLDGHRTYACDGEASLASLVKRLTDRNLSSFSRHGNGGFTVSTDALDIHVLGGLHIYEEA